jgi:hypothetical protein
MKICYQDLLIVSQKLQSKFKITTKQTAKMSKKLIKLKVIVLKIFFQYQYLLLTIFMIFMISRKINTV